MNIKELAKIISYIRINSNSNCVFMDFDLYNDNKLIEHFYCEGVYNQIPKEDKLKYNETNYRLPFFYREDDFFEIWTNNALECAELIERELFGWLDLCNKIKITVLHNEVMNKNFTIKVYEKKKRKKKKILLNARYK